MENGMENTPAEAMTTVQITPRARRLLGKIQSKEYAATKGAIKPRLGDIVERAVEAYAVLGGKRGGS